MRCPNCGAENPYPPAGVTSLTCLQCATEFSTLPPGAGDSAAEAPPRVASPLPPLEETPPARPSGKVGPGGVPLLLAATVLGSAAVAGIWHLISMNVGDLFLISGAIAGSLLGGLLVLAVRRGQVRNPWLGIACAVVAAAFTFGFRSFYEAMHARPSMVASFARGLAQDETIPLDQATARVERGLTPLRAFRIYLKVLPEMGMTLTSTRYGRTPRTYKGGSFWAHVLMEYGMVAFCAAMFPFRAAKEPYCEACTRWATRTKLMRLRSDQTADVVARVRAQDWVGLSALPRSADQEALDISLYQCDGCKSATINVNEPGRYGNKTHFQATMPPEAADAVRNAARGVFGAPVNAA